MTTSVEAREAALALREQISRALAEPSAPSETVDAEFLRNLAVVMGWVVEQTEAQVGMIT